MHDYHSPMTPVVVEMMAILMVAMASAPVLWSLVDLRGCLQVIILYPHMQISADLEGRRCPRENLERTFVHLREFAVHTRQKYFSYQASVSTLSHISGANEKDIGANSMET